MKPWTYRQRRYRGINANERVKAILDCVALQVLGGPVKISLMTASEVSKGLQDTFVDVSQNPSRRAFTNAKGEIKCLHTNTQLYSFDRDGIVLPFEHMLLQGHSQCLMVPTCMSGKDLQDLAGMGICLPCIGLVLVSMMATTGL